MRRGPFGRPSLYLLLAFIASASPATVPIPCVESQATDSSDSHECLKSEYDLIAKVRRSSPHTLVTVLQLT